MDYTGERYLPEVRSPETSCEHWHRYLYASQFVQDKLVIDIACGEGYGTHLLAESARKVVGVDISAEVIAYAAAKYKRDNLEFLVGSAVAIPLEGEHLFDVFVSFETIEHLDETEQHRFLSEARRLLKPGGLFVVSTPNRLTYSDLPGYKNKFHVREFYVHEFREFLSGYFPEVELLGQRIYPASYLWPERERLAGFAEYRLALTDEGFRPDHSPKEMVYIIALCSETEVPAPTPSVALDLPQMMFALRDEQIEEARRAAARSEEAVREKETTLQALAVDRDRLAAEKESANRALAEERDRLAAEKHFAVQALAQQRDRIADERDEALRGVQRLTQERDHVTRELEAISKTNSWKAALSIRRLRGRIAPDRTRREKAFRLMMTGLAIWREHGTREFTREMRGWTLRRMALRERVVWFEEWFSKRFPRLSGHIRPVGRGIRTGALRLDESTGISYSLRPIADEVVASGLFDPVWYLAENPDVRDAHVDPLEHYLRSGAAEGRNPHPLFNASIYARACGDAVAPESALVHFLRSGLPFAPGAYRSPDVLMSIQRSYLAKTELRCNVDGRSRGRRFAVYFQCGAGSMHGQWLGASSREWDLIVNHYDDTYIGKIACEAEFQQVGPLPGTKFTSFLGVMVGWPHLVRDYEYVLLLDDDVVFEEGGVDRLFKAAGDHSLDLAQASLSTDSSLAHPVFKHLGTKRVRHVNAVEIMMPVISQRSLRTGAHLFTQTVSGWGLDLAISKLAAGRFGGRAGVVDGVVATHLKPIDPENGAFYRMLHRASIYPEIELTHLQRLYGVGRSMYETD